MKNTKQTLTLVSVDYLEEIKGMLEKALDNAQLRPPISGIGEFIDQKTASELLGRKGTWFFEMRKSGKLPYSKAGSKVYYQKSDLFNLIKKIS